MPTRPRPLTSAEQEEVRNGRNLLYPPPRLLFLLVLERAHLAEVALAAAQQRLHPAWTIAVDAKQISLWEDQHSAATAVAEAAQAELDRAAETLIPGSEAARSAALASTPPPPTVDEWLDRLHQCAPELPHLPQRLLQKTRDPLGNKCR